MNSYLIIKGLDGTTLQIYFEINNDTTMQTISDKIIEELKKLNKILKNDEELFIIVCGKKQDNKTKITKDLIDDIHKLTVIHYIIRKKSIDS